MARRFPNQITNLINGKVALTRIQKYMQVAHIASDVHGSAQQHAGSGVWPISGLPCTCSIDQLRGLHSASSNRAPKPLAQAALVALCAGFGVGQSTQHVFDPWHAPKHRDSQPAKQS